MRKKKMVRVSAFILLVVLLSLIENERSFGLPTKIQSNDHDFEKEVEEEEGELTPEERAQIRQILTLAAKEITDKDIIQVLEKSLILRMRICFSSPLPSLPPKDEVRIFETEGFGVKRDEGLSPDQKHILRKVLQEALEYVDEEELLEFLKSSLYFRLLLCLHNPLEGPFPEAGPSLGGSANKPTPSQMPGQMPDSDVRPPTDVLQANGPYLNLPNIRGTGPSHETRTTSEAGESFQTGDKGSTENDMPDLPEMVLKNAIASIPGWNEISDPERDVEDLFSEERTEVNRDSSRFSVSEHDPSEHLAELKGLQMRAGLEKKSLAESISDNGDTTKLSQSLPNGKQSTTIDESDESRDGAVGATLNGVGKAALGGDESLTENSDEGEFQSVIMIDYDDLADEEKTGTDKVDHSLIEPNEELSL